MIILFFFLQYLSSKSFNLIFYQVFSFTFVTWPTTMQTFTLSVILMCPAHFNSWHLIYNSSLFYSIVWSKLTSSYCYHHAFLRLFSRDFMNFLVLHPYVTVSIIHHVLNLLARCLLLYHFFSFFFFKCFPLSYHFTYFKGSFFCFHLSYANVFLGFFQFYIWVIFFLEPWN